MIVERDKITFSNGRLEYVSGEIIGLALAGDLGIYHGYDGTLYHEGMFHEDVCDLTTEEILELARHMVAAWTKVVDKFEAVKSQTRELEKHGGE